ncbi:MAG TPA: IucA/IucC family protein [Cellvibrio sp.]|nr:IucA/IucC family protein [Cellvibrio sp.]
MPYSAVQSDNQLMKAEIFQGEEYVLSRRRLFKQLIQALLYENTVEYTESQLIGDTIEFKIYGVNKSGQTINYCCKGYRRVSFGRVELNEEPIVRHCGSVSEEVISIREFLTEIDPSFTISVEFKDRFIQELEHTLANDTAGLFYANKKFLEIKNGSGKGFFNQCATLRAMTYDDIESNLHKAHPYHPCYKSRIGFSAIDNFSYGPEFSPELKLIWLAVKKENCLSVLSPSINEHEFYVQQLGDQLTDFHECLRSLHFEPVNYLLIPVHPWQWLHHLLPLYTADFHQGNIVFLGEGSDSYRPQQSIRTMANKTHPEKPYAKLALSIVNTSTSRGLAEHTIANAPVISDWLFGLVKTDKYLSERHKITVLREMKAISFSSFGENIASGKIACLWRESLHNHISVDEQAIPFSGLTEMDRDKRPIIDDWILHYGVYEWLEQFVKISVLPLIRLLYVHGVAMESHAQNMILVHKNGWPTRIALKDFHDGIRFMPGQITHGECLTALHATPQQHLATNSSSYISASEPEDVKDFLYSAFFSMNLSEFALFFDLHYGISEASFWELLINCIDSYQREFPEQYDRFQLFDLQSNFVSVEAHTKRRLQNESQIRVNRVKNPLSTGSRYSPSSTKEAPAHE